MAVCILENFQPNLGKLAKSFTPIKNSESIASSIIASKEVSFKQRKGSGSTLITKPS